MVQTPKQYKCATKLIGFDFEIFYKLGKENKVADAHRRREDVQLLTLSSAQPTWVSDLKKFYQTEAGQKLVATLVTKNKDCFFCIRDGLVYKNTKLFVLDDTHIFQSMLQEYHSITLGGHSSVAVIIR